MPGDHTEMKRASILLAVDSDPASVAAVDVTASLAVALRASVAVLHVERPAETTDAGAAPDRRAVEELALRGAKGQIVVRGGDPADEILAAGRALGCTLIVMGSRGRSALGGLLLGSVSREVTARAMCPVLVVRAKASLAPTQKIVLAIEGVAGSDALVDTAAKLAGPLNASVVVVHVSYPGGERVERALYHARTTHGEQAVALAVSSLRKRGIDARPLSVVAVGGISRALAKCAESVDAQMIIMGSHQGEHPGEPAGTELSTAVVHRTRRPVLVMPETESS